jgi:hypothetical protein
MLSLIAWIALAFYPRYWLAGVLSVLFYAWNISIGEQFRDYSPSLADAWFDRAASLAVTFAVFAFGIVFIRKMITQMRAKTDAQLAAILERARSKSE